MDKVYYWHQAAELWLKETEHKRDHPKDQQKIQWLSPFLDHLKLIQIDRQTIRQIGIKKKEQSSPSTANRYLALIRSILRRARNEWEWIEEVPHIRLFQEPTNRIRWLTKPQAKRLIDALPPHLSAMARFSLLTGLRESNVTRLQWPQIDFASAVIRYNAEHMKSGRPFVCPLSIKAINIIERQRKYRNSDHSYVFTYKGRPVNRCNNTAWRKALKRLNIEDFRWHDLRHTWASWHVQNGTSLQQLQELGDWVKFEMVLRYAHLDIEHLRESLDNANI